ncbi:hypothetical protein, partial [Actinotignum sp. GS-2025b]|uniref:hypothetical protein n=1 Tax=Actinotignum sp. GS-2025b TaxID=3427275 RepID=UPI003F482DC3
MAGSVNDKSNTYPVIELVKYVQAHGDQQSLFGEGEGEGYGYYLGRGCGLFIGHYRLKPLDDAPQSLNHRT